MKTEQNPESLTGKISKMLEKARIEIEEFALQFTLGKADASDKFEEVKKALRQKTAEWKQHFSGLQSSEFIKSKLDELEIQLALGKAEAKDLFVEQKKKILASLHVLESELNGNSELKTRIDELKSEIEKFKIKLEILELQFELKAFEGSDKIKDAMSKAKIETEKLFGKIEEQWADAKNKSADFSSEISKSFEHLKKAIRSL